MSFMRDINRVMANEQPTTEALPVNVSLLSHEPAFYMTFH